MQQRYFCRAIFLAVLAIILPPSVYSEECYHHFELENKTPFELFARLYGPWWRRSKEMHLLPNASDGYTARQSIPMFSASGRWLIKFWHPNDTIFVEDAFDLLIYKQALISAHYSEATGFSINNEVGYAKGDPQSKYKFGFTCIQNIHSKTLVSTAGFTMVLLVPKY
jgi:hypothetical protein